MNKRPREQQLFGLLPPFDKAFYQEHDEVKDWPDNAVDAWRASHALTVKGQDLIKPVTTFAQALPPYLLGEITKTSFQAPTPIQSQ
eukprot:gene11802-10213_t